jgi:hypothetical protein
MFTLRIVVSCLLLTTSSAVLAQSQENAPKEQAAAEMRCGGQYECVEERLLTPAEARSSIAYPSDASRNPSEDTSKVASTKQKPAN